MFRSIVLFSWRTDATEEEKTAVATELAKLPDLIDQVRRLDAGPDAGVRPGNANFGVVADFDSVDDYLVYLEHPAHMAVVTKHIKPLVADRAAVQFEL